MMDTADLLRAYDEQLRTDAEAQGAASVVRHGPLWLVTLPGGRHGFVTYRDLGDLSAEQIARLVPEVLARYRAEDGIDQVEWKTRGHDRAPGLHGALVGSGFAPGAPESVMIGAATALAVDVPLPDGVTLRRVTEEPDVRAMCAMQDEVFGEQGSGRMAEWMLGRLASGDGSCGGGLELWVAEAEGQVVSAGRLEPVAGTSFAGIWGGSTRAQWRGRGIYRALTAARARSALAGGRTLVHSDSTEYSRPILERAGLVKVSTTTPYLWRR